MSSRGGWLALWLSLGHAAFALRAQRIFPQLGPAPALPDGALAPQLLAWLALALAVVVGLLALRRARGRDLPAVVGLALAAPFAMDALVSPVTRALGPGPAARWIFIVATELALVGLLWAARAAFTGMAVAPAAPRARASRRGPSRPVVLLVAVVVALLLGEGLARAAHLGERRYSNPMLLVPGDERRVPLSEITLFRPFGMSSEQVGLSARWRPYLFLKGWYDRPTWPYFDSSGCVDYVFNRYGLRDHDFELQKAPGEFRVVAIGDSFTFGVGVQLDDCWTEVLERGLRERLGRPVEVINAGFASGYHPGGYEKWIVGDGIKLQPDVVAIGLCLNDLHTGISLYADEPPEKFEQPLDGRCHLLNALQAATRARPEHAWTPPDYGQLVRDEPQQWDEVQGALRRTHEALAAAGIRLLVVPLPMVSGLAHYPYTELHAMVAAFCEAEGIEHLDLLPRFLGQDERSLWVHPTDQHPNDKGQRIIGEGVLEYLAPR